MAPMPDAIAVVSKAIFEKAARELESALRFDSGAGCPRRRVCSGCRFSPRAAP